MFDNEIDWVMRIGCASSYQQAARFAGMDADLDDAIQGRAHCKARMEVIPGAALVSVQCKKSVFRSAVTVHVNAQDCSQGEVK